jgi:hypothetical protein
MTNEPPPLPPEVSYYALRATIHTSGQPDREVEINLPAHHAYIDTSRLPTLASLRTTDRPNLTDTVTTVNYKLPPGSERIPPSLLPQSIRHQHLSPDDLTTILADPDKSAVERFQPPDQPSSNIITQATLAKGLGRSLRIGDPNPDTPLDTTFTPDSPPIRYFDPHSFVTSFISATDPQTLEIHDQTPQVDHRAPVTRYTARHGSPPQVTAHTTQFYPRVTDSQILANLEHLRHQSGQPGTATYAMAYLKKPPAISQEQLLIESGLVARRDYSRHQLNPPSAPDDSPTRSETVEHSRIGTDNQSHEGLLELSEPERLTVLTFRQSNLLRDTALSRLLTEDPDIFKRESPVIESESSVFDYQHHPHAQASQGSFSVRRYQFHQGPQFPSEILAAFPEGPPDEVQSLTESRVTISHHPPGLIETPPYTAYRDFPEGKFPPPPPIPTPNKSLPRTVYLPDGHIAAWQPETHTFTLRRASPDNSNNPDSLLIRAQSLPNGIFAQVHSREPVPGSDGHRTTDDYFTPGNTASSTKEADGHQHRITIRPRDLQVLTAPPDE